MRSPSIFRRNHWWRWSGWSRFGAGWRERFDFEITWYWYISKWRWWRIIDIHDSLSTSRVCRNSHHLFLLYLVTLPYIFLIFTFLANTQSFLLNDSTLRSSWSPDLIQHHKHGQQKELSKLLSGCSKRRFIFLRLSSNVRFYCIELPKSRRNIPWIS